MKVQLPRPTATGPSSNVPRNECSPSNHTTPAKTLEAVTILQRSLHDITNANLQASDIGRPIVFDIRSNQSDILPGEQIKQHPPDTHRDTSMLVDVEEPQGMRGPLRTQVIPLQAREAGLERSPNIVSI